MQADSVEAAHTISIGCGRGTYMPHSGHRARCSCGWWSDCYAQLSDTQRAVDVHLRRVYRVNVEDLIVRPRSDEKPTNRRTVRR